MHERDLPSNVALFYGRTKVTTKLQLFTQLDNVWRDKLVSLLVSFIYNKQQMQLTNKLFALRLSKNN
jgi:hypothetical protein